jgi:hypothetical protein
MITRIVFAGGAQVEVPLDVEQVKDALQQEGQGRGLSALDLTHHDRSGNPIRIYINLDQVAFIMDAESTERPVEPPRDNDELREESSPAGPESTKQPVTDLWGNPIRPRRRRR